MLQCSENGKFKQLGDQAVSLVANTLRIFFPKLV